MIDGIYHVRFSSSTKQFGEGLVVVSAEAVNGGDHGYLYMGKIFSGDAGRLTGKLQIKRWNASVASIFGAVQSFDLDLSGSQSISDRSFQVTGNVSGHPVQSISIAGKYLADIC